VFNQTASIDDFRRLLRGDAPEPDTSPAVVEIPEYQDDPDLTDEQYEEAVAALENQFEHHLAVMDREELVEKLSDKWWRMNNLYYIINKKGRKVLFQLNLVQRWLYNSLWFMNLILKSRQHGFTTFIAIFLLDECLFNADKEAGIIAHNLSDAQKIFRRKVKYPYDNLLPFIRAARTLLRDSSSEMAFNNNSVLQVSTSYRSGTLNYLHVSEFGKICAKYPEKAREIVTGALEAIQAGQIVFIESTAEGRSGYFFRYCQDSRKLAQAGALLSKLDFKFFFFAWWEDPGNILDTPVPIPADMAEYFEEIEGKIGRKLQPEQKHWYVKKQARLGEDMKREQPSTPDEAFEQSVEGAYFKSQFIWLRKNKRITKVPYMPSLLVHTAWDLGMNDTMAIWFYQNHGRQVHLIDYFEASGEQFAYYAKILFEEKKEYHYGEHLAPHDIAVRELGGTAKNRWGSAKKVGIHFFRVPRVQDKLDSIEAARNFFDHVWIDEEKCHKGIEHLEGYRKEWDEHLQTWKRTPLHNEHSNGADAFQTLAMGHKFSPHRLASTGKAPTPPDGGWT
jgi:hypothetical protein